MTVVKLSSKNQIVVPREARRVLEIGPGNELLVVPKGRTVLLVAKPKDTVKALSGTGKQVYKGKGSTGYLKGERRSWKRRNSRKS